ncbi:tRNA pseudouridine(38-40) synthase TruA [Spiroplasma cantharicola]|uniref:tRNA pseudouridine synthase A n=1 Tax=Spiroplasma cantharicola TaxID=362837 RepID=A0A0M4KD66_9MOLU|nr:tRNA pseudouridine(38-40) synthase TruA [Spiroplasma cantharicola]ALD66815.1 tRNA pseudouridine synthase A [Spiroplasma cantharicola]
MYYYLLTIEYDGTDFCGWAKQNRQRTIQGEIEKSIAKVAKNSIFRLVGASKTDSGVHAEDQKAWVELNFKPNIDGFLKALNRSLPLGIQVKDMNPIKKEFRVRNCKEKTYEYRINLGKNNVFENRHYFLAKNFLDIKKIKEALNLFVGNHDFLNFSGIKIEEIDLIKTKRKINSIECQLNDDIFFITFKAKGFIRYQIRMIVGACLAYSLGKITLDKIVNVLKLREAKMPYIANPEGLILKKITY